MRNAVLVLLLLSPAMSCTAYESLKSAVSDTRALIADGKALIDVGKVMVKDFKSDFKQARASADTNQDGKTSIPEWVVWLTSGGGLAFVAALIRNGKSDVRKAKMEAKADEQERRIAAVERVAVKANNAGSLVIPDGSAI